MPAIRVDEEGAVNWLYGYQIKTFDIKPQRLSTVAAVFVFEKHFLPALTKKSLH